MVKIVFFGSGPVAAKSLFLLAKNFDIECVITKRSPSNHRGEVPVLQTAEMLKIPILQVSDKADLDNVISSQKFESSASILIDFGIIVSNLVIESFPQGIINSHFSLLPEWRGADPISFALLSGQQTTGVSLMLLTERMDEGEIIGFGTTDITPHDTATTLTEKLIELSNALLETLLPPYLENGRAMPQLEAAALRGNHELLSYSAKLSKEDGHIDWSKPASVIEREIRAYETWPKSRTQLGNIEVIIVKAHVANPNELSDTDSKRTITIDCGKGTLVVDELRPIGKKTMGAAAFLAGYAGRI